MIIFVQEKIFFTKKMDPSLVARRRHIKKIVTPQSSMIVKLNKKYRASTGSINLLPKITLTESVSKFVGAVDEPLIYNIEFLSTWGSSEQISCAAIWFLDDSRRRIEPTLIKCEQIPDYDIYNKLTNPSLIKEFNNKDTFRYSLKELNENIVICFYFDPNCEPRYLRIWNPTFGDNTSLRMFKVSLGRENILTWEVPMGYGTEVSLVHNTPLSLKSKQTISQIFLDQKRQEVIDDHGYLPIKKSNTISLHFLKNYGDPLLFGLMGIEILNEKMQPYKFSDIENIFLENTIEFTDPATLFSKDCTTNEFSVPFIIQLSDSAKQPRLIIKMKKPSYVCCIKIFNANIPGHNDIGVKYASLTVDKNQVWIGKFNKSMLNTIWVSDKPKQEESQDSVLLS